MERTVQINVECLGRNLKPLDDPGMEGPVSFALVEEMAVGTTEEGGKVRLFHHPCAPGGFEVEIERADGTYHRFRTTAREIVMACELLSGEIAKAAGRIACPA